MNTTVVSASGAFRWVLEASWQAAVLAVLVLLVQLTFRKRLSPAWRYGLWLLVVARIIMPVSPESAVSIFNLTKLTPRKTADGQRRALNDRTIATVDAESNPVAIQSVRPAAATGSLAPDHAQAGRQPTLQPTVARNDTANSPPVRFQKTPINWFALAGGLWIAGICVLGTRLVWATLRFRSRLAHGRSISDANINRLVVECGKILRVREQLSLVETTEVESPAVWGLFRKRMLLPAGALDRFTTAELRHILLHELAHIKRRDLEVQCLVGLLQIVHWFNPILWLAFARMRADRELATDALALARGGSAEAVGYGETILKVLEGLVGNTKQPGLVGIAESKARMKERIVAIAGHGARRTWGWAAVMLAVILAGIGLTSARQNRESVAASSAASTQKKFAIRVLDYDSGGPLSGVTVSFTLNYYSGNSNKNEVVTGEDGRAAIQLALADLKHFAYQARKTNYLALRGEWYDQQLFSMENECQIKLAKGVEIGGTVTDDDGKPVSRAEISWDESSGLILSSEGHENNMNAEIWFTDANARIATTDSEGKWKARCVWPTATWISLRIHHPDFADTACSTQISNAMEAEGGGTKISFDDLAHFRAMTKLIKGVTVSGRVMNEAGEPVSGITVNCWELLVLQHAISDRLLGKRIATSDASGKFRFDHVPPKQLYFQIQTNGYAPSVAELDAKSSNAAVELRLVKGRKFVGQIVDKSENGVGNARVSVADFGLWRDIRWETTADATGRFEWSDAPLEKFELLIQKDGFITAQKIAQAGGENETKIRLNRTLKITGKVSDAESKDPVKSFRIEWLDRNNPNEFEQGYRFSAIPCSNGIYTLDVGKLHAETWYRGYAHDCILRFQADGYVPVISRAFSASHGDVGDIAYDVELKRARQIEGTIVDSDGRPVAGAQVALKIPSSKLRLSGQTSFSTVRKDAIRLSDAQGKFRLDTDPASQGLVAVHDQGFAEMGTNNLSTNLTIQLQRWGQMKGTVWDYDKPLTNQEIWVNLANQGWPQSFNVNFRTNTDAQGEFAFNFVPPGKYRAFRMIPMGNGGASSGPNEMVTVKPGETAIVKVGGVGRAVVGRFKITNPYVPIEWPGNNNYFNAHSILPKAPEGLKSSEDFEAWRNRPEIQRAYDTMRNYPIVIATDASFRMDEVLPGKYEMQIQIYDPRERDAMAYSKYICQTSKSFEVPKSDDRSPLDVGTIEISLKPDIKKGETAAPDFEATDMADKKFKLSDFRGKYVLLDFWATWCGPCIGEMPYLKQVHDKFKDRRDLVMLSLSLDKTLNAPREFLKTNSLPWVQGYLGDWPETKVPEQYGVQGIPAIFVISPEGKIIDSELQGSSMIDRLNKHLK